MHLTVYVDRFSAAVERSNAGKWCTAYDMAKVAGTWLLKPDVLVERDQNQMRQSTMKKRNLTTEISYNLHSGIN